MVYRNRGILSEVIHVVYRNRGILGEVINVVYPKQMGTDSYIG